MTIRRCNVCGKRCSKYNEVGGQGASGVHYCERPGCEEAFRADREKYDPTYVQKEATPLRFYVAGSSKLISWARAAMALVAEFGHEVTQDWTRHFEPGSARGFGGDLAREDLAGVDQADAILFLFNPDHISAGAWCEFGYAMKARKPIFVVMASHVRMKDMEPFIFLFLSNVVMSSSMGAAIQTAENMMGRRGNVAGNSKKATMPPRSS